jgi:hypothetical protein
LAFHGSSSFASFPAPAGYVLEVLGQSFPGFEIKGSARDRPHQGFSKPSPARRAPDK